MMIREWEEKKKRDEKKKKINSHFSIISNEMIRKLVFIFLGVYIILNSTYGGEYHRKNQTHLTTHNTSTSDNDDEYYDDYDYRISDGCTHKLNHIVRYSFTLLIISCFK
jgi:hypothetical protein